MENIYGFAEQLSIKKRIDNKIVISGLNNGNWVLSQIESIVLQEFNGGRDLEEILAILPGREVSIIKIYENFIDKGILVKNSARKIDLSAKWTLDEVFFELTKQCNLRCHHCYIPKEIEKKELGLEKWFQIVDSCKDLGVGLIKLTGGEAMLHPHFWDIVKYINKNGISMRLYTNGSCLNKKTVENLKTVGISEIQISLDGGTEETHDTFRNAPGNYKHILRTLPILIRFEIRVILSFTVTDYNVNEINLFIREARQFPNVKIVISPYINYHQTYQGDRFVDVSEETVEKLKECFENNKNIWSDKIKYSLSFSNLFIGYCGFGIYSLYIDSFGKIILCPLLGNIQLGTITDGIENIWENSKILMEYRSHTIADIEKCNTCKNVNVCKGGCRARAYFINGSILACDPVSCKMY